MGLCEKIRTLKLKIQEKHTTLSSLLIFSPKFILGRELYNTSVLSSYTRHKIKLFAGRLGRKLKERIYVT